MPTNSNDKILFSCPTCLSKLAAMMIHAGKTVRCRCGALVEVPLVARRAGTSSKPPVSEPSAVTQSTANQSGAPTKPPATKSFSAAKISPPAGPKLDLFTFSCTQCNRVLKVRQSDRGKACRCRCGVTLTIPLKSEDAEKAAQDTRDYLALDFEFNFDADALNSPQPQDHSAGLDPPQPIPPQRPE